MQGVSTPLGEGNKRKWPERWSWPKLPSRIGLFKDYLDLESGTIRAKFDNAQDQQIVTEHVGIGSGLSVISHIHSLTEADWNIKTRLSSFFRNILILLSSIKIGIFRIILINQSVTLIAIKKLEHRVKELSQKKILIIKLQVMEKKLLKLNVKERLTAHHWRHQVFPICGST